jgi:adenine deaminase
MTTSFTKNLIEIAKGRKPPDQVIRKGKLISVQSGEFVPTTEIAIKVAHFTFIPIVVDPDEQEKT